MAVAATAPVAVATPPLRLAASRAIEVYQGGTNRLSIKITREGFAEPVTVKALDPPPGVRIDPITIPADHTEFELPVSAGADAAVGAAPMTLKAECPARPDAREVLVTTNVNVRRTLPPPAALRISVSPEVALDQAGKNRLGILIARDNFTGPVTLALDGLPNGVAATDLTVPEDASKIEVEMRAAPDAAVGTTTIAVTATGRAAQPKRPRRLSR